MRTGRRRRMSRSKRLPQPSLTKGDPGRIEPEVIAKPLLPEMRILVVELSTFREP
jgi:hypothetical protein